MVNMIHLEGVFDQWTKFYGVKLNKMEINPIGDLDINLIEEDNILNQLLYRQKSKNSKSEPAVTCNYIT